MIKPSSSSSSTKTAHEHLGEDMTFCKVLVYKSVSYLSNKTLQFGLTDDSFANKTLTWTGGGVLEYPIRGGTLF